MGDVGVRRWRFGVETRLIAPPPRACPAESLVILAVVAVFALQIPLPRGLLSWLTLASCLGVAAALVLRAVQLFHLAFFLTVWLGLQQVSLLGSLWPLGKIVPLAVYGLVALAVPELRRSVFWLRPGRFDSRLRLVVLVLVAVSGIGLWGWYLLFRPQMAPYQARLPEMSGLALPLAGLAFAAVNAVVEEIVYRGLLLQALDSAMGPGFVAVLIQAGLYGWMHLSETGFPRGGSGALLAAGYGLVLGLVRRQARGLLAPWLAHAGADLVIFTIVVLSR